MVENMRTWPHSGFSVDQSVFLPAGDGAGIERLVGYMTRCPFSLSRLVKVTQTGQVIYKAEKDACRAFPDPQRDELARGPTRNFQILDPLDFLAEFTKTWAMLIKRVYEVDPLACPNCGGVMKVVAFIEPPPGDVIEKILRGHRRAAMVGGLWCLASPRAPPAGDLRVYDPDGEADRQTAAFAEPRELTFVDMDTFEAAF
ncbi:MAG: transposase [Planctomycetota bacterium]|nr:transposase [Planctomycetota bacterium]